MSSTRWNDARRIERSDVTGNTRFRFTQKAVLTGIPHMAILFELLADDSGCFARR
jgi:hypothetical protein